MMSDTVYEIIYRSHISEDMDRDAISDLMTKSILNNAASGITGCLLICDRCFFQILEGTEKKVKSLFNKIKDDHRHEGVDLISESTRFRLFDNWGMAFAADTPEELKKLIKSESLDQDDLDAIRTQTVRLIEA